MSRSGCTVRALIFLISQTASAINRTSPHSRAIDLFQATASDSSLDRDISLYTAVLISITASRIFHRRSIRPVRLLPRVQMESSPENSSTSALDGISVRAGSITQNGIGHLAQPGLATISIISRSIRLD